MTREELVEKVEEGLPLEFYDGVTPTREVLTAATDIVLEEAAKIAESAMLPCDIGGDLILDRYTSDTIAKAIRALKGE